MAKMVVMVQGGQVQEIIMDQPVEVYVLDFDCKADVPAGIESDFVDGEECINAFYGDVIDPQRVERIISQLK